MGSGFFFCAGYTTKEPAHLSLIFSQDLPQYTAAKFSGKALRASMFRIADLIPQLPRLKIVDVGAMSLGEGTDAYAPLADALPCDVIGFEPVESEFTKLRSKIVPDRTYLPYCIGDGKAHTFFECNMPMTSSLFEPNTELLDKFQNLGNATRVVKTYRIQTVCLDDVPDARDADYLKVDVQGGEVLVYSGSQKTLDAVLVVHTEVSFVELYKHQALFADVDAFLRNHGFTFHRLLTPSGRTFKPLVVHGDANASGSQLLWADAVYVRDFMSFDRLRPIQLLKIAAILHELYKSYDLAALALEAYDRQTGSRLQPDYLLRLTTTA